MKTAKRNSTFAKRLGHPEVLSSACFFFFDFLQNASSDDFKTMLDGLVAWSEHSDDEGNAFTRSLQRLCGVPVIERDRGAACTFRQLKHLALKKPAHERIQFLSGHLDLVDADSHERAFLAICQRLLRQEMTQPSGGRDLRITRLLHEASTIMTAVLDSTPSKQQNSKSVPGKAA